MKVFISWSGPQSNYIAKALRDWLRHVIQNLTPWMSEVDTPAGERWGEGLWKELQDSQFGVVCLTAENLQSPWLHYEAGALAKAVDRRVCPYLYEIKPIMVQGPLSHHQAKQVDKQGTKELVHSINAASLTLTERGLPSDQFDETFSIWWPELEKKLSAVPLSTIASPPQRNTDEMLEEILEISRSLAREAASAQEIRERETASAKKERLGIILKSLAERANSELIEKLSLNEIPTLIEKISRQGSISGESLPPSDTSQGGKPPSK